METFTADNYVELLAQCLNSDETVVIKAVEPEVMELIQAKLLDRLLSENITLTEGYYELPERRVYFLMEDITEGMTKIILNHRETEFNKPFMILCSNTGENVREVMEQRASTAPFVKLIKSILSN